MLLAYLSHGTIFTKSKTIPVPSEFLAQTGCEKGWNESAQQSNGVLAPGCGASGFLQRIRWN